MPRLLLFLSDPAARERFVGAIGQDEAQRRPLVRGVAGWPAAREAARAWRPHALVFDPCAGPDDALAECVAFRAAFPHVVLVPYTGLDPFRRHVVLALSRLGVRELLLRGVEDTPLGLRHRLDQALEGAAGEHVFPRLDDLIPPGYALPLRRLFDAAESPLPDAQAAHLLHRAGTTRAQLESAGLPPVRTLVTWFRLFHAAYRIAELERPVDAVARSLAYPSPRALHSHVRRYTGRSAAELRRAGGLEPVVDVFRARAARRDWSVQGGE